MSGTVIAVLIGGFFVLVIGLLVYSIAIDQPRLRRQLQEQSDQHGWTYTSGKALVVTRRDGMGHLLSPQETISQSFQGKDQGVSWQIDAIAIARKNTMERSGRYIQPSDNQTATSSISHHIVWHSDNVRIEHGSVLLYVKPMGWTQGASASGVVKAGFESIHANLIYDLLRKNWGVQNTPVSLDLPELEAKYQVEGSDMAAMKAALPSEVCQFLVTQRPPDSVIHIGDTGMHIVVSDDTYLRKFEKLVALADYGVQLANGVAASQHTAASVEKPDAADSTTL